MNDTLKKVNKLYIKILGDELVIKKEVIQMIYSMDGVNAIVLKNPDTRELSVLVSMKKQSEIVFVEHFESKTHATAVQNVVSYIKNYAKELDMEKATDFFLSLSSLSTGQKITNRDEIVLGHRILKNVILNIKTGSLYFRSKELGTEIERGMADIETSGYKYKKIPTPKSNKVMLELKEYVVPMLFQSGSKCLYEKSRMVEAPTPETAMFMVLKQKEYKQNEKRKVPYIMCENFGMPLILQAFLFEDMKDVLRDDKMIFQYTIPNNSLRIGCNLPGQDLIAGKMDNMGKDFVDSIRKIMGSETSKQNMNYVLEEVKDYVRKYTKKESLSHFILGESYEENEIIIKSKLKEINSFNQVKKF